MAVFNRKTVPKDDLPEELQQYYPAERKDRSWLAWLLALGSLLVVVLLFVGIFFGVRWIYDRAHNKDKGKTTIATSPTDNNANQPASNGSGSGSSTDNSSTANNGASNNSGSSSSTSTTTPPPSSSSSSLSNTGPGNLVAVFVVTSTAAAGLHYIYTRRKISE